MTTCAVTATAVMLLACLALDNDRDACAVTATNVYGGEETTYSDNASESNYDGDDDDDDDDGGGGGGVGEGDGGRRVVRPEEDQLDQDDPVSTVTVTAIRGAVAWLPCDINGGDNDGLPVQSRNVVVSTDRGGGETGKDLTAEDRAYMVLWFKHQKRPEVRRRNGKWKDKKRSSGGKPLYSFDVRGRPLAHALKWSSDVDSGGFGARASFVVFAGGAGPSENGNKAALRVANVSEQDAGPYRCRVDFRDSPTRNYRIILRVIVPADRMTIVYNGGTEIGGDGTRHYVVGPVPEGGQMVLVCRVLGGKPRPRVRWYSRDGEVAASTADPGSSGGGDDDRNTTAEKLVIGRLNRNHANSTYTCVAGNDDVVESNLRMTVLINMYLNVKSVRIADVRPVDESENTVNYNYNDDDDDDDDGDGDNDNNGYLQRATNLISGKWYTVQCWAEGASPKATIEWSIDGNGTLADEQIPSPPTSTRITVIEQTERSSRIRLRPTPNDDGRYLRCRAWNPDINTTRDHVKNKAILLNVQYAPIVKLSLGHTFDPGRIKTGDDVYFECKILDGGGGGGKRKQHNRIEWYHNGRPIVQNGNNNGSVNINSDIKVVLLSAGTLVIRNVGRRHSGRYTCQCSNDLGVGRSLPVTLRVQYAPVCADDGGGRPRLVGAEKTEDDVRVTCRVNADPSDDLVQFEWSVWPGDASADARQTPPNGVAAAGNYVTTALSAGPRNGTAAAGLVVGELVLPAAAAVAFAAPPDVQQPQRATDRAPNVGNGKPAAALSYTVSCRATNAVGRQHVPCLYHIVPAASPGPLTGCAIRLPKDQERRLVVGNRHRRRDRQRRHRRTSRDDSGDADDVAVVSCVLENDGGVRPVTYALEIYESNVLTASAGSAGAATSSDGRRTNTAGNKWLAGNVTGAAVRDSVVEYRVDRRDDLRLRTAGPGDRRKYISLSAYASNRVGRGPQTYFDGEHAALLRHAWWWRGAAGSSDDVAGTKKEAAGTSSSEEWWITLRGDDDDRAVDGEDDDGGSTDAVVAVSLAATITAIVVALVCLWRKRDGDVVVMVGGPLSTGCAADTTNPTASNDRGDDAERSLPSRKQRPAQHSPNVYPDLNTSDDAQRRQQRGDRQHTTTSSAAAAPDITIRRDYGKRPCLVSIANREIPGPESCV